MNSLQNTAARHESPARTWELAELHAQPCPEYALQDALEYFAWHDSLTAENLEAGYAYARKHDLWEQEPEAMAERVTKARANVVAAKAVEQIKDWEREEDEAINLAEWRKASAKARVSVPMEARPFTEPPPAKPAARKLPFTWVREFGPLMEPPKLRWLFTDTRTGKPVIRGGKCYALTGDGGVGKGIFTLQTACSVVTGTVLLDTYEPKESGRVAILAAEDDTEEIHHRLARIVAAFDLDVETIREKIGIFPLSGEQVNLLRQDANHNQERTQTFKDLVDQLTHEAQAGGFEWSLVVMDPLARFGADNVEIDQSAATALVAALEHLAATVPGKPAVQLNHHSSSASVQSGRSNVRGVTGLRNAFRLVLTLDAFDTDSGVRGVLLRNDKNNLAPKADPVWLVRMENEAMGNGRYLDTAGVMRRANADEQAQLELASGVNPTAKRAAKAEAKLTEKAENFEAEAEAILSCLPVDSRETISRDQLCAKMGSLGRPCAPATLKPRIQKLIDANLMVDLSDGGRSTARKYARVV